MWLITCPLSLSVARPGCDGRRSEFNSAHRLSQPNRFTLTSCFIFIYNKTRCWFIPGQLMAASLMCLWLPVRVRINCTFSFLLPELKNKNSPRSNLKFRFDKLSHSAAVSLSVTVQLIYNQCLSEWRCSADCVQIRFSLIFMFRRLTALMFSDLILLCVCSRATKLWGRRWEVCTVSCLLLYRNVDI